MFELWFPWFFFKYLLLEWKVHKDRHWVLSPCPLSRTGPGLAWPSSMCWENSEQGGSHKNTRKKQEWGRKPHDCRELCFKLLRSGSFPSRCWYEYSSKQLSASLMKVRAPIRGNALLTLTPALISQTLMVFPLASPVRPRNHSTHSIHPWSSGIYFFICLSQNDPDESVVSAWWSKPEMLHPPQTCILSVPFVIQSRICRGQ